jgi:hypothetical protein
VISINDLGKLFPSGGYPRVMFGVHFFYIWDSAVECLFIYIARTCVTTRSRHLFCLLDLFTNLFSGIKNRLQDCYKKN